MHNLDTEGMGVHIYSWGVISGETHSPIQVIYITWSGRKGTGVTDCDGLFGSNSSTSGKLEVALLLLFVLFMLDLT